MGILIPKSKLGKWSVTLIILMPIFFFIGSILANSLYDQISSGTTILEDFIKRPILTLTMFSGMITGIIAFIIGLISIIKKKEKGVLVYISTLIGLLFILFLIAEIISPH